MPWWVVLILVLAVITGVIMVIVKNLNHKRKLKDYERQLKLVPLLIHLPPSTDDIEKGGRDERDVNDEAISSATVMYNIIASTIKKKSMKTRALFLTVWTTTITNLNSKESARLPTTRILTSPTTSNTADRASILYALTCTNSVMCLF